MQTWENASKTGSTVPFETSIVHSLITLRLLFEFSLASPHQICTIARELKQ
jgi:hypothetical protein